MKSWLFSYFLMARVGRMSLSLPPWYQVGQSLVTHFLFPPGRETFQGNSSLEA